MNSLAPVKYRRLLSRMCLGVEFRREMKMLAVINTQQLGVPVTMKQSERDAGTIVALVLRMTEYRLPRAQRLLERVNKGEKLRDNDIRFLKRIFKDSRTNQSLIKRNPEYLEIVSRFLSLYVEITTKALENEKTG